MRINLRGLKSQSKQWTTTNKLFAGRLALGLSELAKKLLDSCVLLLHLLQKRVVLRRELLILLHGALQAVLHLEASGDLPLVTHEEVAVGSSKTERAEQIHLVEGGEEAPHLRAQQNDDVEAKLEQEGLHNLLLHTVVRSFAHCEHDDGVDNHGGAV